MLSKLLKYDFKATLKYFIPCTIFIVIYSCTASLFFNFYEIGNKVNSSIAYSLLITVLTAFFVILAICYVFGVYAICIVNFYKSMVTDQGYLTHTLPVKKSKILLSKFISSNVLCLISLVIVVFCVMVYFDIPTLLAHYSSDISKLLKMLYPHIGVSGYVLMILCLLTSSFSGISMFYIAIALGQLVNKHKALSSILFYFALLFVYQIAGTIIGFVSTSVTINSHLVYANENGYLSSSKDLLLALLIGLLGNVIVTMIQMFFTHFIFQKKLNLE